MKWAATINIDVNIEEILAKINFSVDMEVKYNPTFITICNIKIVEISLLGKSTNKRR